MNVWKLTAANRLEMKQAESPSPRDGKIRVRITKVLLNSVDAALYAGAIKEKYPLVMGRFAIGLVAEENAHLLFPKGTRVILHTFCPAGYTGTARRDFSEDEIEVRGQTSDGFLSDFVLVSPNDMTPLPSHVNDEKSLVVNYIALAKATIEKLGIQKGQHIAVVGANLFGIFISQLLIYQQAAPILIDADERRLAFARTCGVYYTLLADDRILTNVAQITGGRLASGAIYVTSASGNDNMLPFSVCAQGRSVVISGLNTGGVTLNFELALKKQLSVHSVWNCSQNIETAINLIANRAINLAPFHTNNVPAAQIAEFLASYGEHPERDVSEFNVVNLV